ncbi:hypothetical protein H0H92_003092 [Tricholoma furcatifolium]|nr:hypothetical protein H0H92_003092 [Tricholoma furcatifolium]
MNDSATKADLKAIAANGCYGTSAITALTSQNTTGVQAVQPTPPAFVEKQIHSILDDIETHAIKTGMLYDKDCIRAVYKALTDHYGKSSPPSIVCDPVCVSTSGHSLLDPDAVKTLIDLFFPLTTLITPNKAEAELLLSYIPGSSELKSLRDMITSAKTLLRFGSQSVLLKGGHIITSIEEVTAVSRQYPEIDVVYSGLLSQNMEILQVEETRDPKLVADVLSETDRTTLFVRPHIESSSTHGTGCTLSAAIASQLACGNDLRSAVKEAVEYTHLAIKAAEPIGHGHGPLNHFHALTTRLIPRASSTDPYPFTRMLIEGNPSEWKCYVQHDFVKLLGRGTLSKKAFVYFLMTTTISSITLGLMEQSLKLDRLLAAKSTSFKAIQSATQTIMNIITETATHKSYCAHFGVTEEELENTPEGAATTSYGAYLIDIGLQGDGTKLIMALLACLLGYGEVGLWLKKEASLPDSWVVLDGNPYKKWMDDYSGEEYQRAVKIGLDLIEGRAADDTPSPIRLAEWVQVWQRCTLFEKGFWDAAMAAA